MDPQAPAGNSNMVTLVMLIALIAVMYFLMIRPQRKKEREISSMRNNLRVGDDVITIGGIRGKIVKTKEDILTIQVGADKIKFEIMRWGISTVVSESTNKQVKADKDKTDKTEDEEEEQPRSLPKRLKPKSSADSSDSSKDSDTDSEAREEK